MPRTACSPRQFRLRREPQTSRPGHLWRPRIPFAIFHARVRNSIRSGIERTNSTRALAGVPANGHVQTCSNTSDQRKAEGRLRALQQPLNFATRQSALAVIRGPGTCLDPADATARSSACAAVPALATQVRAMSERDGLNRDRTANAARVPFASDRVTASSRRRAPRQPVDRNVPPVQEPSPAASRGRSAL